MFKQFFINIGKIIIIFLDSLIYLYELPFKIADKLYTDFRKKHFCAQGKHKWEYYTMGNRLIKTGDHFGFWDIPARVCEHCSKCEEKRADEYLEYKKGE